MWGLKRLYLLWFSRKTVPRFGTFSITSLYLSIYLRIRTIHRFVYYRVPPGSSPILVNFSIRKLSGAITFDWKGLFSIRKKPLVAKDLFYRFDTRVGAVSGGAGAWLGPKSVTKRKRRSRRPPPVTLFPTKFGMALILCSRW